MSNYPTIERLIDPTNTTVGYQSFELVSEAANCYRALQRAEARAERYRKALAELVAAWGKSDDDTNAPRFIAAMDAARAALEERWD